MSASRGEFEKRQLEVGEQPRPDSPAGASTSSSNETPGQNTPCTASSASIPETVSNPTPHSHPSFVRRFTGLWSKQHRGRDDEDTTRGPLGLSLLHSSPDAFVDLIFVHGLRGGSMKTWRKGDDARLVWPQLWLPLEPGFQHANIHSFGYDSDWASTKASILGVHDFGQSLLEEMRNSPCLRRDKDSPIVLVGHSMGGLVIKKAFLLACHVPEFQSRIKSIFFLATPHKGSDYAAILDNILMLPGLGTSRQYVTELKTSSISIQKLNSDFIEQAHDLAIFSFYETLRMSIGISSALIVDKDSAVLGSGYINERAQYLNANHRDMCKFESRSDPNYITLLNALSGTVRDLLRGVVVHRSEVLQKQINMLQTYLGILEPPDEYYQKVEGSCQWINERPDFEEWRDPRSSAIRDDSLDSNTTGAKPWVFWVRANPGTGKTHLASHVIAELQGFHLECAYYYFHNGIREKLVGLCQKGSIFEKNDPRAIWNTVFKKGIFQSGIQATQYWVIDALDECTKYQELFTMLRGENITFPLRIFLTSRKMPDIPRLIRTLEATSCVTTFDIPEEDSISDIDRYIKSRIDSLPVDSPSEKEDIASTILRKSKACFLWVRMVFDELEQVYSQESILHILHSIPEGMVPYYERTVKSMSTNKLEKHITEAVLLWVATSTRPMTLSELSQALKLDINTILPSAKSAIEGLCGQLVTIQSLADTVDVVHATAREFLFSPAAGEFSISKPHAHARMAMTCLKLLCSSEMQPPRNHRLVTPRRNRPGSSSPLLDYAITQFSEHIYGASSEGDDLLLAMARFFKTNVLSWIEKIAAKGDLDYLIRASKNLKAYLDRGAKHHLTLSGPVQNLSRWVVDLTRVVMKFGSPIVNNPSCIYFLIPPFCPAQSDIFRQFGKRPDGLAITGFRPECWVDCVATVKFGDDVASAVSCGDNMIAVGMESGDVNIYNHRSCQKLKSLHLDYPIDLVHLADSCIIACTTRSLLAQDLDGNTLWETRLRFRCILLTSASESVVAVSQHGHVLKWDISTGALLSDQTFPYTSFGSEAKPLESLPKAPFVASLSPGVELVALGYRGGTVCLWEVDSCELIGWAMDPDNRLPVSLLFNPNPDIGLLLVTYTDHTISIFDIWSGAQVHTYKSAQAVNILSAACSPDGRTLVTTDVRGNLWLWDFESLSPLYHVVSPFPSFRIMDFTSDGSGIVDVMDSSMRVWSPAALIRETREEDSNVGDDAILITPFEGQYHTRLSSQVTCICTHPILPLAFVGKHNGQVLMYGPNAEEVNLYTHPSREFITQMAISSHGVLATSDVAGTILVWQLEPTPPATLAVGTLLFKLRLADPVRQICFDPTGNYLLICTVISDMVYYVDSGICVGFLLLGTGDQKARRWVEIAPGDSNDAEFVLLSDGELRRYGVENFPEGLVEVIALVEYPLEDDATGLTIDSVVLRRKSQTLVVEVSYDSGYITSAASFIFDLAKSSPGSLTSPLSQAFTQQCKRLIGVCELTESIFFLHRTGWISSVNLNSLAANQCMQHFFVPDEYTATRVGAPIKMTVDGSFVLCLDGEVSVVKNGLKFQDVRDLITQ